VFEGSPVAGEFFRSKEPASHTRVRNIAGSTKSYTEQYFVAAPSPGLRVFLFTYQAEALPCNAML
jgi:hypothetical protein